MSKKKYLNELADIILKLKNRSEMTGFLESILTPEELEQLPVRLQILKMLKSGTPQRKIADELGVGIATVTRGSRELKSNSTLNKLV